MAKMQLLMFVILCAVLSSSVVAQFTCDMVKQVYKSASCCGAPERDASMGCALTDSDEALPYHVMSLPSGRWSSLPQVPVIRPSAVGDFGGGVLIVPDSYFSSDKTDYPLILWMHGSGYTIGNGIDGQDALVMDSATGAHQLVELGFMLYLPLGGYGYSYDIRVPGSFAPPVRLNWFETGTASVQRSIPLFTDVRLIRAQVLNIMKNFPIDPINVHWIGESRGAAFTLTVAPYVQDIFTTFTAVSGGKPKVETELHANPPELRRPLLFIYSDNDGYFNPVTNDVNNYYGLVDTLSLLKPSMRAKFESMPGASSWDMAKDSYGSNITAVYADGGSAAEPNFLPPTNAYTVDDENVGLVTIWNNPNGLHTFYGAPSYNKWMTHVFDWMTNHASSRVLPKPRIPSDVTNAEYVQAAQSLILSGMTVDNDTRVASILVAKPTFSVNIVETTDFSDPIHNIPASPKNAFTGTATIVITAFDSSSMTGTLNVTYASSMFNINERDGTNLTEYPMLISDDAMKKRVDSRSTPASFTLADGFVTTSKMFADLVNPSGKSLDLSQEMPDIPFYPEVSGSGYGPWGYPLLDVTYLLCFQDGALSTYSRMALSIGYWGTHGYSLVV